MSAAGRAAALARESISRVLLNAEFRFGSFFETGGCHVRIKRVDLDGKVENPVVHTMYDGVQFGELALMAQ